MNDKICRAFLRSRIINDSGFAMMIDQWPWTEEPTRELVESHINDMFDFDIVISHERDPDYGGCYENTKVELVCCTAHAENMRYTLWSTASDDEWSLQSWIKMVNEIEKNECKWKNIEYGDLMPIEKFIECCKDGGFIDYDGSGNYSNGIQVDMNHGICPSDVMNDNILPNYSHVVWYNR